MVSVGAFKFFYTQNNLKMEILQTPPLEAVSIGSWGPGNLPSGGFDSEELLVQSLADQHSPRCCLAKKIYAVVSILGNSDEPKMVFIDYYAMY